MLFALLHEIHFAESALIRHLFRLDVLWREKQLFRIRQKNALPFAGVDHFICFRQRHAKRLFTNYVLAGVRDIHGHLSMKVIRSRNRHHFDIRFFQHLAIVQKYARNPVLLR